MTQVVGGSSVSPSYGQISNLSELGTANTLTSEQLVKLREKLMVRIHNLLIGQVDYSEHGDTGHTVTISSTINALKQSIDLINDMLKDPTLVGESSLEILVSEFDNPSL